MFRGNEQKEAGENKRKKEYMVVPGEKRLPGQTDGKLGNGKQEIHSGKWDPNVCTIV